MKGKLKKLFVNHGEKIGMVVVLLGVIMGLTKADWAPYTGTPGQITTKVREAEQNWDPKIHQWPKEEAEQFEIKPENEPKAIVAAHIGNAMPLSEYSLTQKFVRSPYEQNKALTNPEWKVLEEPLATQGRVLLAVIDEEARKEYENRLQGLDKDGKPLPPGTFPGAPKAGDENIPDEFRTRITTGVTGTQGDAAGLGTAALDPLTNQGAPAKKGKKEKGAVAAGSGSADPFSLAMPGAEGGVPGMLGMPGAGGGLPVGQKGRGFHYASIRAVFPVRDQISKIQDATNLPQQQAAMALIILDYRIERQTKQESGDPWGGPWEPVDVNVSTDVLTKMSVGLEPDVVYPQLTDPAMTMPLPARVSGMWKKDVTHPRIEKFTLTDDQIQQEVKFQQEMLRKLDEMQKELPPPPAQKAGWTGLVLNGSQLQNVMMGGDGAAGFGGMGMGMGGMPSFGMPGSGAAEMGSAPYGAGAGGFGAYGATAAMPGGNKPAAKLKPIEELLKMDEKKLGKELKQYIEKAVNVVGELLLFRYIDFSVEPGKTYRYRARLVFKNPNFNLDADRAAGDTSVVTGETRMSDWSDPTQPVTIQKDQQSFVTDVKPASGSNAYPTPQLNVFQWDPNLGSVQQSVLNLHVGQTISGKNRTDVLDPAKASFEKKEYTFQSSDYIVDAQPDVQLEPSAHPEVKATGGTNHLGLPEQVLVALSEGGVSILDPSVSRQAELDSAKYLNMQNETWKKMKEQASAATDTLGAMPGAEAMYDAAMTYGLRGANPLSTKGTKKPKKGGGPSFPTNN